MARVRNYSESSLNKIKSKLDDRDIEVGSHGRYIQLSNRLGFKFYYYKDIRNRSYKLQKLASQFNLAPKVYRKFSMDYKNSRIYGYFTQHFPSLWDVRQEPDYKKLAELKDELLNSIKFYFHDDHTGNFSYYKDKLYCIDFV